MRAIQLLTNSSVIVSSNSKHSVFTTSPRVFQQLVLLKPTDPLADCLALQRDVNSISVQDSVNGKCLLFQVPANAKNAWWLETVQALNMLSQCPNFSGCQNACFFLNSINMINWFNLCGNCTCTQPFSEKSMASALFRTRWSYNVQQFVYQ